MTFPWFRRQLFELLLFAALVLSAAAADADSFQSFDIPAGEAERTLKEFATQSGLEVLYSTDAARGVRTKAVKGRLLAREAVKQMLSGTPLYVVSDNKNGVLRIGRINDPNAPRAAQKATCADPKNLPAPIPPIVPQQK
jgi:iron complex outermembrane recepter protein